MNAVARDPRLRLRARIELGDYPVSAAWSPDGSALVVAGGEGAVLLVSIDAAATVRRLGQHPGGALAVAWQQAGNVFASSGQDGAVVLWDARSFEARPIHTAVEWSEHLAFSDNGRLLAVATGRALRLFDTGGALREQFTPHPGAIAALAWRPKSGEIAATGNGGLRIHRQGPEPRSSDYPWRGACLTASWSADGRVLAAGMQDGSVHLWYVASGTQSQMQGHGSKVHATGWSASGRYLVAAASSSLFVWDCGGRGPEGSRPLELRSHSERISALACRPSGPWLVSAARDRRLLLWRLGTGGTPADTPQDGHLLADECTLLCFSRNGTRLAVGDARGGLSIFDWP
jgi:WD40 repeat protein